MQKCRQESSCWNRLQTAESPTEISPNTPQWLISCIPQATSTWDPFSVVPCESTPAQSRSWAGKDCVKPSGWGWQCSCSTCGGGMKVPVGVSGDLWLQTQHGSVTWESAWCQSQLVQSQECTGFLLTKIYYHVLQLGGRRKAVRNLQEWALGPGSRESSFSAKLCFTAALFLPGGCYRAACNEVTPTTLLPHSFGFTGTPSITTDLSSAVMSFQMNKLYNDNLCSQWLLERIFFPIHSVGFFSGTATALVWHPLLRSVWWVLPMLETSLFHHALDQTFSVKIFHCNLFLASNFTHKL